jgi:hypothetical protein
MIVRLFFAAVLSAVLVFAWSFLFWTVFGGNTHLMIPLPSENHLIAELRQAGIASGMYLYPVPIDTNNQEATEVFNQQHRDGPLLQLAYKADGGPPMSTEQNVSRITHYFAVALIAGAILAMARNALCSYWHRVGFVLLLGLFATVWLTWGNAIWWYHPWIFAIGLMLYELIVALLMSLVLAAFIKPTLQPSEPPPST